MAKSIRSKFKKQCRRIQRSTVGQAQASKLLRKATRSMFKTLASSSVSLLPGAAAAGAAAGEAAGAGVADTALRVSRLRSLLSGGLGGAGAAAGAAAAAALALEGPLRKKKLRYTFNAEFRRQRVSNDLEDETDDEAQAEVEAQLAQAREDEGAAARAAAGEGEVIEEAAVTRAPNKPASKLSMTGAHYEWLNKDIAQPNSAGFYDIEKGVSASRQRWKDKRKAKSGARKERLANR